jgi:hypothetical protein
MNAPTADTALVERQAQALLDLIEADRERRCAQALDEAHARAAAQLAQARAEARSRMRQLFAEQRQRRHLAITAAQARLATQRRLHEQQHTAALLRLAWQQLPAELHALWRQPAARTAWVNKVLAAAREHMLPGGWRIVHAADWPAEERRVPADRLAGAAAVAPVFEADATVGAGLKVVAGANVIDGTLAALLADRADIEARLLRRLENTL